MVEEVGIQNNDNNNNNKGTMRLLMHLLVTVFLGNVAWILVIPAITDVTMEAVCPGRDECSFAIYLSGFQQVVTGIGSVAITPLIGNLSDVYGRKTLLTLPLTGAILPLAVLAYSRERNFFYAYYVLRTTLGAIVCEASMICLALAYVADVVPQGKRATSFGILNGVISAAFVCGTLTARFLSTQQTFQVAAFAAMTTLVYMRIFLKETIPTPINEPILQEGLLKPEFASGSSDENTKKVKVFKNVPSVEDIRCILKSSKTLSQIAVIVFFNSLSESGLQSILLYFLKARFQFNKNQFADLMLIVGIAGMISQFLLMPLLTPILGEVKLLSLGLLVASASMFFNSIAWSVMVPYVVAGFSLFSIFASPCMRSIASKQVSQAEQGKAQGCISGISSFGNIISPLICSPITALFLSDGAPFHFPGFSLMCIGLTTVAAFVLSTRIRVEPILPTHKLDENSTLE